MAVIGETLRVVQLYQLSTPWDVTTASLSQSWSYTTDTTPAGLQFGSNNTKMFILTASGDVISQYNIS